MTVASALMGDIILSLRISFSQRVRASSGICFFASASSDRPHLLVEVVLLLGALHLLLDAAADLPLDRENLDLGLHPRVHLLEALRGRETFEQLLSLLELEVQVRDDRVRQTPGRLDRGDGVDGLRRHLLVELDEALEGGVHGAHQRLDLHTRLLGLLYLLQLTGEEGVVADEATDPDAALPFHEHLDGAIREPKQLDDRTQRPDRIDVFLAGLVLARLALGAEQELAIAPHGVFERLDRPGASDEERHHHVRKDDDVAQR